jgi:hypothetical protein
MVQFTELRAAAEAQEGLNGTTVPSYMTPAHPRPVTMRLAGSTASDLTVKAQGERSRCMPRKLAAPRGGAAAALGFPWCVGAPPRHTTTACARTVDTSPTRAPIPTPTTPLCRDYTNPFLPQEADVAAAAQQHQEAALENADGCCVLLAVVRAGGCSGHTIATLLPPRARVP